MQIAFLGWTTLVALACISVVFALFFWAFDRYRAAYTNPLQERRDIPEFAALFYPGMSPGEVNDLLNETWSRPLTSEPFTGFTETIYKGKYVNVSKQGYRLGKDQASWPPQKDQSVVAFLFGGSTTFSYGVPDEMTLGSVLQEQLTAKLARPVSVFNFGRGFYYSTQERILFEQLLLKGHRPDIAIFVDGINDFFHLGIDVPTGLQNNNGTPSARALIDSLSISRFARALRNRLPGLGPAEAPLNGIENPVNDRNQLLSVIDRYFGNIALIEGIAEAIGVQSVFVWQPTPYYKYDLEQHLFRGDIAPEHIYAQAGYPVMQEVVDQRRPHLIWCADLQEHLREPLYVDGMHYSPKMIRMVAQCITDGMKLDPLGPVPAR
jgi:hypothetical protein